MKTLTKLYWLRNEKKDLDKRIKDYDDKIAELSNLGSAPITDMPRSSTVGNPTDKYVTKLIELKDKRQNLILKTVEVEAETEEFIKNVEDAEIRTIMRKYYIDGLTWNEIVKIYYKRNCDGSTPRKKVSEYLKKKGM